MSIAKQLIDECNKIMNEDEMNSAPAEAASQNASQDETNNEIEAAYQNAVQEMDDIMA